VLADFIREGHFYRHIRRMRMIYGERRSALMRCLTAELGRAEVTGGSTGLHLSVIVDGIADRDIAAPQSKPDAAIALACRCWSPPRIHSGLRQRIAGGNACGRE
jgi:GntR family transcriptional regulator/MocR family aminotransferase